MKTIEPIFELIGGNLYPILTKFSVIQLRGVELVEIKVAQVLVSGALFNKSLDTITIYNLDRIRNSSYKDEMDRIKVLYELDNNYYPNSELTRRAKKRSVDTIRISQELLLRNSKKFIKWPDYNKMKNYIDSSPEDLIEVVGK